MGAAGILMGQLSQLSIIKPSVSVDNAFGMVKKMDVFLTASGNG